MRKLIAIAAAILLGGCAAQVTGNSQGGIMPWHGINEQKAFAAAQEHCQKYGKDARINQVTPYAGGSVTFDCVRG